jgi:hypothetical protein
MRVYNRIQKQIEKRCQPFTHVNYIMKEIEKHASLTLGISYTNHLLICC